MAKPVSTTVIEATYAPLVDDKGRRVSGYAVITEYAASAEAEPKLAAEPFVVKTYATRDGKQFGASFPRGTWYATREAAVAGAHKALAAQGRRYAKTFGAAS